MMAASELQKHKRLFSKYNCPQCKIRLCSRKKLQRHISSHTRSLYQCHLCLKVYKNKDVYRTHKKSVHAKPKGRKDEIKHVIWKCVDCKKGFKNGIALKKHRRIKSCHATGVKTSLHKCSICLKEFLSKEKAEKHLMLHQVSYKECTTCSECF